MRGGTEADFKHPDALSAPRTAVEPSTGRADHDEATRRRDEVGGTDPHTFAIGNCRTDHLARATSVRSGDNHSSTIIPARTSTNWLLRRSVLIHSEAGEFAFRDSVTTGDGIVAFEEPGVDFNRVSTPDAACLVRLAVPEGPLRIARLQDRTMVLGPGRRCVVWFQGCSLSCRGCIAATMNAAPPLVRTTPARLAEWCLGIGEIDGITLSGGDPFDQPLDQLAEFLELVRARSGFSVLLYTGRTIGQLRCQNDPLVDRCLAAVDILVDGPYVEALNDGVGWRGSSNQVIHAIGPRAGDLAPEATTRRRVELIVNTSGTVSFTGIPRRGLGAVLAERLERCSAKSEQEGSE